MYFSMHAELEQWNDRDSLGYWSGGGGFNCGMVDGTFLKIGLSFKINGQILPKWSSVGCQSVHCVKVGGVE